MDGMDGLKIFRGDILFNSTKDKRNGTLTKSIYMVGKENIRSVKTAQNIGG